MSLAALTKRTGGIVADVDYVHAFTDITLYFNSLNALLTDTVSTTETVSIFIHSNSVLNGAMLDVAQLN